MRRLRWLCARAGAAARCPQARRHRRDAQTRSSYALTTTSDVVRLVLLEEVLERRLVGYVFFGGVITGQQLLGMIMAIAGMMAYSRASQSAPAAKPAAQEEPDDESSLEDLLQKNKANNV